MSYVRIIARRDDGVEVEVEWDPPWQASDPRGLVAAEQIRIAADKAIAAITAHPAALDADTDTKRH